MKFKTFAVFGVASIMAVFGAVADDHKLLVSKAYYAQHLPTVPTLPTGTSGNVVTYNSNGSIGGSVATYDASGTYAAATDAGKIATAAAVETKQKKATCTQWKPNTNPANSVCYAWTLEDVAVSSN